MQYSGFTIIDFISDPKESFHKSSQQKTRYLSIQYRNVKPLHILVILVAIIVDVVYAVTQDVNHQMNEGGCYYLHGKIASILTMVLVGLSDFVLTIWFGLILLHPPLFGIGLK